MSTQTDIPKDEPIIVMTRLFDAPRALVWEAMTDPAHVVKWWGGAGVANPICEMDVRAGGAWHHVMRFPNGHELRLDFVFVEVDAPSRLVWKSDAALTTVTFEEAGDKTRYTMVARFPSLAAREAALGIGYTSPIQASHERLAEYLKAMPGRAA